MNNIYKYLYNHYGHIFSITGEAEEKNGKRKYIIIDFLRYYKDQEKEAKEFLHNVIEDLKDNFKKYNFNSCTLNYKNSPELLHYAIEIEKAKRLEKAINND